MKIVFNMVQCGLGNNGGTKTILLCQKALMELGHQVEILATIDRFSWFPHKKVINQIPDDTEVLVATACSTVRNTICHVGDYKRAWYIRGHENWTLNEIELLDLYKNTTIHKIVNSRGLQHFLFERYRVLSDVVYQGIDFDNWNFTNFWVDQPFRIGCLYHNKATKNWTDFVQLAKILNKKFPGKYEFVAYGNIKNYDTFLKEYHYQPSIKTLNKLYNSCHFFFCPTSLEGLHNVGLEAALCGCLIICNDNPMNGMVQDYAFHNKTAMIYPEGDIKTAAKLIQFRRWDVVNPMMDYIKENIGSRNENMQKFVDVLRRI